MEENFRGEIFEENEKTEEVSEIVKVADSEDSEFSSIQDSLQNQEDQLSVITAQLDLLMAEEEEEEAPAAQFTAAELQEALIPINDEIHTICLYVNAILVFFILSFSFGLFRSYLHHAKLR